MSASPPIVPVPARSLGRRVLVLGAVLTLAGFVAAGRPFVPLYDGVITADAYHWLDPPPRHPGNPLGATAKLPVSGGKSPLVAVATPENVPQAQVFAIPGGLVLPTGTTELDISIAAIQPPPVDPPDGQVVTGNVYAIAVTNQTGAVVTADPAAQVSVVLRAPDASQAEATVARYDGTAWQAFGTVAAGFGSTFEAVVTQFGDFALLAQPPAPTAAAGSVASPGGSAGLASASAGSGSLETPAASGTAGAPTAAPPTTTASPVPGDTGSGPDRGLLTVALGGLAVIIVILVGVAAFAPRGRRPSADKPPSRRRNRSGWS